LQVTVRSPLHIRHYMIVGGKCWGIELTGECVEGSRCENKPQCDSVQAVVTSVITISAFNFYSKAHTFSFIYLVRRRRRRPLNRQSLVGLSYLCYKVDPVSLSLFYCYAEISSRQVTVGMDWRRIRNVRDCMVGFLHQG
jgi:hypothetical protein